MKTLLGARHGPRPSGVHGYASKDTFPTPPHARQALAWAEDTRILYVYHAGAWQETTWEEVYGGWRLFEDVT